MPLSIFISNSARTGNTSVEFSERLHRRGEDFTMYSNKGYEPAKGDTQLLAALLCNLLDGDSSGVESVRVTPYSLRINHSRTVSKLDLQLRILGVVRRQGVTPLWV